MDQRWTAEQVAAVAPSPRAVVAAEPLADPARWAAIGADERALWGRCRGSVAEPYETMVDHAEVAWKCTCPSRKLPCKHALALLLLWVRGGVAEMAAPEAVSSWIAARDRRRGDSPAPAGESDDATPYVPVGDDPAADDGADAAPDRDELDRSRDERVARMRQGLSDLDRWLEDRMRTGLADPSLARYGTWDHLAARLVDAGAGALANRVRRVAGLVGASAEWQSAVLAEIGLLHLLAQAGRRLTELPGPLADSVATASGWQVRQADVLAGVPDTDRWFVAGRSDAREDRIEVRRVWLRGVESGRWAMVLSFAAYRQSLDDSLRVGSVVHADLHRYPGGALRALMGRRYAEPLALGEPVPSSLTEACDAIGAAVADEPWLERHPAIVRAAPALADGRWVLTDDSGCLPMIGGRRAIAAVAAASGGLPLTCTVEWSPTGIRPLTVHLPDRVIDVGPVADPSFVSAA